MVAAVLRSSHVHLPLAARLTSLIARSADVGQVEEAAQLMGVHSPQLLRNLMLDLLPRCVISEIRGVADKAAALTHMLQVCIL